ncbi:MAG TPA: hypothetical protein VGB63_11405 [Pedobacter sp.]|jgi:hypothetical protein
MAGLNSTTSHKEDEQLFLANAEAALLEMEKAADGINIVGVGLVAYVPGDETSGWISKMKVVKAIGDDEASFLAIAYTKASEMAMTHEDSGSEVRPPLRGEFGYKGGVIRKVRSGYILATFSGAHWTKDLMVSEAGINYLLPYFDES